MKSRGSYSAVFKARVAMEAIRGKKAAAALAAHHRVHPTKITAWETELLESAASIFGGEALAADGRGRIVGLQAKIGELTMERSFLDRARGKFPCLSGKR